MMTAAQFAIFEDWWSETIQAGALAFDIKLHDDADGTAWFTVNMTQPYKFEVMGGNADKWKITATLRSTAPSFTSRRAGTDKLKSKAQVVTFSEEKATLQVTVGLYAASNVAQISNSAYMAAIPFYSVGQISVVGYGKFYVAAASGLDFSKASQSGYVALLF